MVVVLGALILDLSSAKRHVHPMGSGQALGWTLFWFLVAAVFNVAVYFWFGAPRAVEFATAYVVEEALSVDNMFVFYVIFSYFAVQKHHQHRVLFWGIMGAMILRGVFIAGGVALLQQFHWLIYAFGAFLVYTGINLFFHEETEIHPETNPILKIFRRLAPVSSDYHGSHFTVVKDGRRWATPLLVVLVFVESTDVMFALDSIPAVLAITRDSYIAFTSNIFAILGLRALYFLLAGMIGRLRFLHYGLALVLVFIGVKMLIEKWYTIPNYVALPAVAVVIGAAILISLKFPGQESGV